MDSVADSIGAYKIVPVVKIENENDALPLGQALLDGGLPVAEITFRTEAAEASIRAITREFPDMLVGAGTVLKVDQARAAVDAGARFVVSPGFNPKVVDYCLENAVPVIPGVNSPTQVEMGLERDLKVLKFFPAEASGGLKMLSALAAVYGDVLFMPTGGINRDNILAWLAHDKVLACGGSWMVKAELISARRFDEITARVRDVMSLV